MSLTDLHPLLRRQLRRHLGPEADLPAPWLALVQAINASYQAYDDDRVMGERSLQLSAAEVEQKAAELRAVFEAIPDCMLRLDYQGKVLDYKRGERSLVRRPELVFRGQSLAETPLAGVAAEIHQALQVVQSERQIHARELVIQHEGQTLFYEARFIPLPPEQCMVMMRDVTQRKQAETQHRALTRKLIEASRLAGMSDVAASVLHNVGNSLNSLNVSATVLRESVAASKRAHLSKALALLPATPEARAEYLTTDEKGRHWTDYLGKLAAQLQTEQQTWQAELAALETKLGHTKALVAMHQRYVQADGVREPVALVPLIEDAVQLNATHLREQQVQLQREFAPVPVVNLDRHKLLQIVTQLLRNAAAAVVRPEAQERSISLQLMQPQPDRVCLRVRDYGAGLDQAEMTQIFAGPTPGDAVEVDLNLHDTANAARELGGRLTVESAGPGQGACFCLELPAPPPAASALAETPASTFAFNPVI